MVVGKTSSSISKTEIFSKFSETQVLCTVFPEITEIPCVINSPLRTDNHPSFSIYMSNTNHIMYKDCKRLRVYTIVDFSFIRTFAPSF